MAEYRYLTNLETFYASPFAQLKCSTNGRYFDPVDSNFLNVLGDYKIGDPIEADPDPEGKIIVTPLGELKANGFVGLYTTLEAILSPPARQLLGWTPNTLGALYVGPDEA